tara:strand:+ start:79 stop:291 length:213 start_codon:yes stop_codon:yes gene_type:complete
MIPTDIYVGKPEAMQAEIGTLECYAGAWLVQPAGDGNWDAYGFDTIEEARAEVAELKSLWPDARINWLSF